MIPFISVSIIDYLIYEEGEEEALDSIVYNKNISKEEAQKELRKYLYVDDSIDEVTLADEIAYYTLYFMYEGILYGVKYSDTAYDGGDLESDVFEAEKYNTVSYRRKYGK